MCVMHVIGSGIDRLGILRNIPVVIPAAVILIRLLICDG